jgi:hypothetical protein
MKNVIMGLVGVAGLAAGANAQNLSLSVLLSEDGGATWSNDVTVNAGQVVQVQLSFAGDGVYGLGGATLRANATSTLSGAGDTAAFAAGTDTGRVGPFNFGAVTNAIFANADGFRIDAAADAANNNTAAGLSFFQRDPSSGGAGFSTANPATVFRFDVTISANDSLRDITIALDQLSRGVGSYYTSAGATRPTTAQVALNSGIIRVVPTPATLALVGLGGLVAGRRRSR